MESSQIGLENINITGNKAGRQTKAGKVPGGVWIRLALLFCIVLLAKGLLITCATFLLSLDLPHCLQSNRTCEKTEREILLLRVKKLTALLHSVTKDSRCQLCPERWLWFWGHCYFFSAGLEKNRRWAESEEFCREHNASLAIIQDVTEMEFIVEHMRTYQEMPFLWLGLTYSQEEDMWIWQDGTPLHNYTFINMQWDSGQWDCADLRGDGSVFAGDCKVYGPWLCEKPVDPDEIPSPTSINIPE
uniref:Natural killer cells antigen CD94-like n=1 Tax=Astyanax mexicanus TaxID=7994 RepID=A0A3B1JNI2_ASTMX